MRFQLLIHACTSVLWIMLLISYLLASIFFACAQRLALLLAKGKKKGLGDKVLLSGLSTRPPVYRAQPSAGPATIPITATSPKRASAHAQRVQHGSNALFNLLSGHIGVPNTTPHHNTLFFHASMNPPVAAVTHTQAMAAAAASGSATREQAQKVVKQQAESWFWPFDAARATPSVTHTLVAVPRLLPSAARARQEAVVRGRAALAAAAIDGRSEEKTKPVGVKTRAQGLDGARSWSMPEFALGNMRFGM